MSTHLFAFYAACTALLLFALGSIVWPLLRRGTRRRAPDAVSAQVAVYRDQLRELDRDAAAGNLSAEELARERGQIDARLAGDIALAPKSASPENPPRSRIGLITTTAVGTALALAFGVWGLYAWRGSPLAIDREAAAPASAAPGKAAAAATLPDMDVLAERLALKMRTQTPDDGEGWALLARSYVEIKRYREAADAFAQAAKRIPNDATLLSDYADALGMANGRTLKGEPAALAQRALKADPKHPKALALAASAAFEAKNYRDAIAYWQRLAAVVAPGSDEARGVEANIAEARTLLEAKAPAVAAGPTAGTAASGGAAISGTVRIAPEVAAKLARDDTLFVYARALTGPAMPLAIVRAKASALPFAFRLDDGQAMLPELRLSRVAEVALTARLSHAGGATPQTGDLEGTIQPVRVGAHDVELVIDQVVR